jgi:hypothetical protein
MSRIPLRVAVTTVACAVLLGAPRLAGAQSTTSSTRTTSTSTSSSTSTTLLPHPFSPATGACIRQARGDFFACRRGATALADCRTAFQTALPGCFAAPAGVTCAKRCTSREGTCLTGAPATRKTCRKNCFSAKRADLKACRLIADGDNLWAGGDASCLTSAQANFDLCRFVCTEAELDCRVALKFCIANCANQ